VSVRVLSEQNRTARKHHQCGLCGLDIEPGTVYEEQRCVDNGEAWTARSHLLCAGRYWDYWRWCGVEMRDVDPEINPVDPAEFRTFLADEGSDQ
jgi:hypothetical protein